MKKKEHRRRPPNPMDNVGMYSPATQVFGRPMQVAELLDRIKDFNWEDSLGQLSVIAALAANGEGGLQGSALRNRTVEQLRRLTGTDGALLARMNAYLDGPGRSMIIAHEEAVRLLQHVVLTYGADSNAPAPAPSEVALWLTAVSDHLDKWAMPDSRPLSTSEELIALAAHALRFNNQPDWMREIARACEIVVRKPSRNKLADDAAWTRLQREAFGTSFEEYAESFLVPFAVLARGWGILPSPTEPDFPLVFVSRFATELGADDALIRRWLDDMSVDRDEVRQRLLQTPPALPHAPLDLLHRPLVRRPDDTLLATSPNAVLVQLKTGIWARLLNASKKIFGGSGAELWMSTFGDQVEAWCVRVATDAATSVAFAGDVIVPSAPGAADEIEDVVVREGHTFVLFSVKARLVTENVARRARSRTELLDWYDDFFFGPAKAGHRQGVLRQLSERVNMIRAGKFEPRVPREAPLLPVLVTYDSMCEDALLYQRIEERCAADGVLTQPDVGPVTIARIDDFETLFARAARGESIVSILRRREQGWRHRRLDAVIHDHGGRKPDRLPMIAKLFDQWLQRGLERLRRKREHREGAVASSVRDDVEGGHHAGLGVLEDVAVEHPVAVVEGNEAKVDRLATVDEDGVAEGGLVDRDAVARHDLEEHPVNVDGVEAGAVVDET